MLVAPSGQSLDLSASDLALARLFARNPDRVMTRAQIIDAISGGEPPENERAIDVRISRLRRRLKELGLESGDLRTVHGGGYKLASAQKPISRVVS